MKRLLMAAAILLLACSLGGKASPTATTPVWVRSHNGSPVDVYLQCGHHDPTLLGSIPVRGSDGYQISPRQRRCLEGLTFLVVVQEAARGYRVGPVNPTSGSSIQLVIEKYAGLSTAWVFDETR
ncbi:MAG TPA: hypothetical protein VH763_08505 [Gemmatimonadales bacterium]|jgi:hypothetical protein